MTLQAIIERVMDDVTAITGIKGASDYLPEALPTTENWVIGYAGPSTFESGYGGGDSKALYSVVIEIHVPRQRLPDSVKRVMAFFEAIPNKLIDDLLKTHLNNTCSTFGIIESSGLISFNYAGVDTIGVRYTIRDVKLHKTL